MTKYNAQQAVEMLEKVVEGREAYVYENPEVKMIDYETGEEFVSEHDECVYSTPEGAPSCIVGHVLASELPEVFDLVHKWEYELYNESNDYIIQVDTVDSLIGVPDLFEEGAIKVLREAQHTQDLMKTWGKALENAKEMAE